MTYEIFEKFVSTFGFPAMLVVALGYAIWKAGVWVCVEILKPVSVRLIGFFDRLESQVDDLVRSTKRMCEGIESIDKTQTTHTKELTDHRQRIEDLNRKIDRNAASLETPKI
jgi:hypothetical protein